MENQTVVQSEKQNLTANNLAEDENLKGEEMEAAEATTENPAPVIPEEKEETKEEPQAVTKIKQKKGKLTNKFRSMEKFVLFDPSLAPSKTLCANHLDITQLSAMDDSNYSSEIINDVCSNYDRDKLDKLEKKNIKQFRQEAANQLRTLWKGCEGLTVHNNIFNVRFLIAAGEILERVEQSFQKKSEFDQWFNKNLGVHKQRYFQHARQLFRMGEFAQVFAALGKNRLLLLDRLARSTKKHLYEILQNHPFPDITEDWNLELFKEHIDGIITFYRLKDAGLDFVDFESARLAASINHDALEVNFIKKITSCLEEHQNKEASFQNFLLDKLKLSWKDNSTSENEAPQPTENQSVQNGISKLLVDFTTYYDQAELHNTEKLAALKQEIRTEDIVNAYRRLIDIAEKLEINLNNIPAPQVQEQVEGE